MDNLAAFLGLSYRAQQLAVGEEPADSVCRAGKAVLLLLAQDAAENTRRRGAHFAQRAHIGALTLPLSKAEMGQAVGRSSCALAALTDPGLAFSLARKLRSRGESVPPEVFQELERRAGRQRDRRREKRIHERKMKRAAEKPWVAPPPAAARCAREKRSASPPAAPLSRAGRGRGEKKSRGSPGTAGTGRFPIG